MHYEVYDDDDDDDDDDDMMTVQSLSLSIIVPRLIRIISNLHFVCVCHRNKLYRSNTTTK